MAVGQLKDILVHLQLRKQEEELLKLEKNKHSFHTHAAKWPELESEAK
jgi:hypothetical protein